LLFVLLHNNLVSLLYALKKIDYFFRTKGITRFTIHVIMNNEQQYQHRIIFYDFETTGLNPFQDDVIDFCFRHNDTSIEGLVNTTRLPLSKEVVDITGITDDIVKSAGDAFRPIDLELSPMGAQVANAWFCRFVEFGGRLIDF